MKKIAIIPLKSDSVRFPCKNFKYINNIPLVANTINKLYESGVDTVIVTTDKKLYAFNLVYDNLTNHRCQTTYLFNRPDNLMGDTKTELVVHDIIKEIDANKSIGLNKKDYIIVLTQATSPLWNTEKLELALYKLETTDADSVISTSPDYKPNGCFYVFKKSTFLHNNKIFTDNSFLITMPWEESIDIDYEHELSISNALIRGNYV
jgi:CMP-N-acetylneuraminic acid synthetase